MLITAYLLHRFVLMPTLLLDKMKSIISTAIVVADRYFHRFESTNPPETSHPDELTTCNNRKQLRSRNEYGRSQMIAIP
jgi:hypothetical protein